MKTIALNKDWMFIQNDNDCCAASYIAEGELVDLPHSWNGRDGQGAGDEYYRGRCWYQKKLELSEAELQQRWYLEIGAAGNIGTVYINGRLAGKSRCGYAMFRVALQPFLKAGDNLIAIEVDNSYHDDVFPLMADFTFYGGLYREVRLLVMEPIHFDVTDLSRDGIYLTPVKTVGDTFRLGIRGRIANESEGQAAGQIQVQLRDRDGQLALETSVPVCIERATDFECHMDIENPVLWDGVDQPYLYTATIALDIEGKRVDVREIEVGFRTVEVTPDRGVLLNGKPVPLRGVSRHQDYADIGNALTQAHMEEDMRLIREMGANSIRLAHYQHDDYFYTLCDRFGILVWAEIPFISVPSTKSNDNALEQLERLIKQAYNHCSIYCWGVQNEITIAVENEQTYQTIREINALAKRLDPQRLTAQANIYSVEDDSPIHQLADLSGYNLYYGWYYGEMDDLGRRLDAFHDANPDVPVLLSEYGVDTNPGYHAYAPQVKDYTEEYQLIYHHNVIRTIQERGFVPGGYVWNMFDFGSALRNEGGNKGKNLKGLVTIDRKLKKDAYYLYKAYWSKEPFVHLAGRRFRHRHEPVNDILILTNLPHLKVYKDQSLYAEITAEDRVVILPGVTLARGANCFRVEGVDEQGQVSEDEMILYYGPEQDHSYRYQTNQEKKHVMNWFEKYDLTSVPEVAIREGYYSTLDTIEALYENEQAKAVFKKYFGEAAEHSRFVALKGVMSIEKMSKISAFNIPKELLSLIDSELNAISKNKAEG